MTVAEMQKRLKEAKRRFRAAQREMTRAANEARAMQFYLNEEKRKNDALEGIFE